MSHGCQTGIRPPFASAAGSFFLFSHCLSSPIIFGLNSAFYGDCPGSRYPGTKPRVQCQRSSPASQCFLYEHTPSLCMRLSNACRGREVGLSLVNQLSERARHAARCARNRPRYNHPTKCDMLVSHPSPLFFIIWLIFEGVLTDL